MIGSLETCLLSRQSWDPMFWCLGLVVVLWFYNLVLVLVLNLFLGLGLEGYVSWIFQDILYVLTFNAFVYFWQTNYSIPKHRGTAYLVDLKPNFFTTMAAGLSKISVAKPAIGWLEFSKRMAQPANREFVAFCMEPIYNNRIKFKIKCGWMLAWVLAWVCMCICVCGHMNKYNYVRTCLYKISVCVHVYSCTFE